MSDDPDFYRRMYIAAQHELRAANKLIVDLEIALRRIDNQDYRGNRSAESQIAHEALKKAYGKEAKP